MWETGICALHTLHTAHGCISADVGKDAFYPAHAARRARAGRAGQHAGRSGGPA